MASLAKKISERFNKIPTRKISLREDNSDIQNLVKQGIQLFEKGMDKIKSNPAHMLSDKPSLFYNMKTSEDFMKSAFAAFLTLEKALEKAISCIVNEESNCSKAEMELEDAIADAEDFV